MVVDSFRTVVRKARGSSTEVELQSFIQRLALLLTSWQATTFLLGEYVEGRSATIPFSRSPMASCGSTRLSERNSVVRKLQIMKLRGQASVPGLHTFRITNAGLQAFSRTLGLDRQPRKVLGTRRLSIGIPELDKMLGGGDSRRRQCPRGRVFGDRKIGIGDPIHCRRHTPGRTRDCGGF